MSYKSKSVRLVFTLCITACFIVTAFSLAIHRTPVVAAPVILMKTPYAIPAQKVPLLDRVMPLSSSWRWVWILRYALFGKTRAVDLNIRIFEVKDFDLSSVGALAKPDLTTADGLQVCRIKEADLKKVQLLAGNPGRILSSLGASTGSKIQCSVNTGSSMIINGTTQQFGVIVDLLPVVRKESMDLTAIFRCSEIITNLAGAISVRTNLDLAGRFQLSQNTPGLLVVAAPAESSDGKRVALLLTSKVQRPKK